MKTNLFSSLGNAILWQATQYGGEKVIFLIRLTILANLLEPVDFGLLATASIGIDVLMRISNFGMTTALVQLENADEEHYDSAWTLDLLRAVIIALIAFFAAPYIANYLFEPRAIEILRALALRPVIDASGSIMIARFNRNLDFRALVFLQIPKAIVNTIISILMAKQFGVWALVAGTLSGSLIFMVLSYILAPHRPRLMFKFKAFQPLANFGRWVFLASIVVMIGQTITRAVISRELGAAELGLYYLAASLAFMPTDIANQIVGKVAFPFYSRLQNNYTEATQAFRFIIISVSVVLFPASILMIAVAPTLVSDVFGADWEGTANIIRVLAFVNLFDIIGETISPILNGTGQPKKIFLLETLQSVIVITLITTLTRDYGAVGAALAWLPATGITQLVGVFFIRRLLEKPFAGLKAPLASIVVVSVAGAMVAIGIDQLIPGLIGFILSTISGTCTVFGLFWVVERRYSLGLLNGFFEAFPALALRFKFTSVALADQEK